MCPRNLAAMCTDVSGQGDLSLFLGDELAPANGEEQATCLALSKLLSSHVWDGLRDHHQLALSDSLWTKLSTDKANCLGRNCHYFR